MARPTLDNDLAANAMFITSGVLAVAAAVLFFVEGRPGAGERASQVGLLFGSSYVHGISVSSRF